MSIVKCKVFDYIEIYVYAQVVNARAFFLSSMPKLGKGLLSNAQLKLPDDGTREWWDGEVKASRT